MRVLAAPVRVFDPAHVSACPFGWPRMSAESPPLCRVGDQSAAPAALGSASAGRIMGRAAYMHAQQEEEPPADEQKLQVALVISVVPGLTPEDAAAILREKGWRVQDAIKSALESNPATFDGQECQIPVGVPVDEVESGRFAFPAGAHCLCGLSRPYAVESRDLMCRCIRLLEAHEAHEASCVVASVLSGWHCSIRFRLLLYFACNPGYLAALPQIHTAHRSSPWPSTLCGPRWCTVCVAEHRS